MIKSFREKQVIQFLMVELSVLQGGEDMKLLNMIHLQENINHLYNETRSYPLGW